MNSLLTNPNFGTNLLAIGGLIGSLVAAGVSIAMFIRQGRNTAKLDRHTEQLESIQCATGSEKKDEGNGG